MKKFILPIALLFPILAFSQDFKLTSDNFKEISNTEKNYYVLECQGKTQTDLFKKAKIYITGKFKGIKNDGYNEVGTDQIVLDVNGSDKKTIIINFSGPNVWTVSNRIELSFKDGKIMIKPTFSELKNSIDGSSVGMSSLFNKKGEPKKEKAILFVESEANLFISEFIKAMKTETSNDW